MWPEPLSGAEIVIRALVDQGVDVVSVIRGPRFCRFTTPVQANSLRTSGTPRGGAVHAAELCALDRAGRRGAGDERTVSNKRCHRAPPTL